jgi:hypothetical protein
VCSRRLNGKPQQVERVSRTSINLSKGRGVQDIRESCKRITADNLNTASRSEETGGHSQISGHALHVSASGVESGQHGVIC